VFVDVFGIGHFATGVNQHGDVDKMKISEDRNLFSLSKAICLEQTSYRVSYLTAMMFG